jgi:YD repeat-containing protein
MSDTNHQATTLTRDNNATIRMEWNALDQLIRKDSEE